VRLEEDDGRGKEGTDLVFARVGELALLMFSDAFGNSFHSLGPKSDANLIQFDYFGAFTEVPVSFFVASSSAVAGAVAYMNGGSPESAGVHMEPD
jgi:hypothetical protein